MEDKLSKELAIQDSVTNAISILATHIINNTPRNKSEVALITKIEDISKGIYKLKFQDLIVTGYAVGGGRYQAGNNVYILIPNNNFQEQIFILGKAGDGIEVATGDVNKIELTKAEYDALTPEEKNNDCIYFVTDEEGGGGGSVAVDTALSRTSTNPVQNKIITSNFDNYATTAALNQKQDTLVAGDNITIENNVISASGVSGDFLAKNNPTGTGSLQLGTSTVLSGADSVALGYKTTASNDYAFAIGKVTKATGEGSFAIGEATTAQGDYSFASGYYCKAFGGFAQGERTISNAGHAEGGYSICRAQWAHAEGNSTTVTTSARWGHAEGDSTSAVGEGSHVEGYYTTATGNYAHAEGYGSLAAGTYSKAIGFCTTANYDYQYVLGKYNTPANVAMIVGNGDLFNTSNALELDWNGNLTLSGGILFKKDDTQYDIRDIVTTLSNVTTQLNIANNKITELETLLSAVINATTADNGKVVGINSQGKLELVENGGGSGLVGTARVLES